VSRRIAIASLIWGGSILLSRLIGLVREAVIGRVLGGGATADVYFTAFTLPDFFHYLLAGGALSIVFIPIFNGHLERGEEDRAWEAFSVTANFILLLLALLLPALWVAAPRLVPLVAPGFDTAQQAHLVRLTRIMLPAQAFHLVGGLLSAVLQARDRHALPAMAPLLYTAAVIAGGLIGGPAAGGYGFAWGVLAGSAIGPFALPLAGCLRNRFGWKPILRLNHPDLKTYLVRSVPIMIAWSIVAVDDWILRRIGSLVGAGAVATLQYGKQLMYVPMGVFGLATGVAAFPTLTRLIARGQGEQAYTTLAGAVRRMLVLAFAAQVVLTCAGREISTLVYGHRIPAAQHAAIGTALALFSLGLWAWAAQTVVARGFYAMGNTWVPSLLGTVLVPLAYPLYVWAGGRWGPAGLAGASSLAVSAYVIGLMVLLRRRLPGASGSYLPFFARMIPATAGGIGAGLLVADRLPDLGPVLHGVAAAGTGVAAFAAVAIALRTEEIRDTAAWLRRRGRDEAPSR
jgi:putative peptidoglycan lipid II flippase